MCRTRLYSIFEYPLHPIKAQTTCLPIGHLSSDKILTCLKPDSVKFKMVDANERTFLILVRQLPSNLDNVSNVKSIVVFCLYALSRNFNFKRNYIYIHCKAYSFSFKFPTMISFRNLLKLLMVHVHFSKLKSARGRGQGAKYPGPEVLKGGGQKVEVERKELICNKFFYQAKNKFPDFILDNISPSNKFILMVGLVYSLA